jgi:hypothetical protein
LSRWLQFKSFSGFIVEYFARVDFFFSLGVIVLCLIYLMAEFETLDFQFPSWLVFFPIAKLSKYSMVENSSFKIIQLLKILVQWLNFTNVNSSLGYLFPHLIFLFN